MTNNPIDTQGEHSCRQIYIKHVQTLILSTQPVKNQTITSATPQITNKGISEDELGSVELTYIVKDGKDTVAFDYYDGDNLQGKFLFSIDTTIKDTPGKQILTPKIDTQQINRFGDKVGNPIVTVVKMTTEEKTALPGSEYSYQYEDATIIFEFTDDNKQKKQAIIHVTPELDGVHRRYNYAKKEKDITDAEFPKNTSLGVFVDNQTHSPKGWRIKNI